VKLLKQKYLASFIRWRHLHINDKQFIYILSVLVGFISGCTAVILKSMVHGIRHLLHVWSPFNEGNFLYFFLPMIGIAIAVLFMKYVVKYSVRHGVPAVLYAISMTKGRIRWHYIFSSVVTSAFTVGFGGSVGLEGPSIISGAAIGSNVGRVLKLNYKQIVLLIACGSTGVMAAIFNSPIGAMIFAMEVIVLNLSLATVVPLLLASSSAMLTSSFFMEQDVLFHSVELFNMGYEIIDAPTFVLLGIITGLVSVYFKRIYVKLNTSFERISTQRRRLFVCGGLLGLLLFLFPALYGEGYDFINMAMRGDSSFLFQYSIFAKFERSFVLSCILFLCLIFIKVIASLLTFGAGGVGGIFAPSLFMGAMIGLFISFIFTHFDIEVNTTIFVLLGMCGMIAGVMLAPLTGIFLIADITSGYNLFVPLMIVSAIAYATVRVFEDTSVYTYLLAKRKQLLSHNTDRSVLSIMKIRNVIETNFSTVPDTATMKEFFEIFKTATRDIFPIIDSNGKLKGIIKLNDIRHILLNSKQYETTLISSLMYKPELFFAPDDDMEKVVETIQKSNHYNFPVMLADGTYVGFISRAQVFSEYRKVSEFYSSDV
jgi:CIC family chloride channel protein